MGKWWSFLFAAVMALCGGLVVVAPLMGWWLPEGVSTHAASVDYLFYFILVITGFFFILTEAILCVFMFKYAGDRDKSADSTPPGFIATLFKPVSGMLNEHTVEIAWTVVPALLLLFIAFDQVNTWAIIKYQSRMPTLQEDKTPLQAAVSARQFEWRVRYPSSERFEEWLKNKELIKRADDYATFSKLEQPVKKELEERIEKFKKDFASFAKFEQKDDVHLVNELHVIKENPAVVHLSTLDVIHSFNLPRLRVKQDALPGKIIPVWFTPTKSNVAWFTPSKKNVALRDQPAAYVDGVDPDKGIVLDAETAERQVDEHYIWDLPCAELCGWGHYRMVGRLFVHKDEQEFLDWLKKAEYQSNSRQREVTAAR
ncbi:MAG TPA: cytochrome c oxidase subunit II transmembrane domain-containing protein [Gemmataceae bacterium]|nr:cytochrome c oxidase subunit II transmembrane domain-containing protein [Gemmataceae bacterium]